MSIGIVFDIQRFSLHNGPGIRTTVFLKGCPLDCLWCHNPESKEPHREIAFYPSKCIGCGFCLEACPSHCHSIVDGKHSFIRECCTRCALCTQKCYPKALEAIGCEMTTESVLSEVMKDEKYYRVSGGGITISGGEPLFQYDFTAALLHMAKDAGLHTCIDTSGAGDPKHLEGLAKHTDMFLYDIKETDESLHVKYTGVANQGILQNLALLDRCGAHIVLRCPIIPGLNDREDHFRAIAQIADRTKGAVKIEVMPYHPLGSGKFERIGKTPGYDRVAFPDDDEIAGWISRIGAYTCLPVKLS